MSTQTDSDDDLVVGVRALADRLARLRLTVGWLDRATKAGWIPCTRAGQRVLYSVSAVKAALAARARGPTPGQRLAQAMAKRDLTDESLADRCRTTGDAIRALREGRCAQPDRGMLSRIDDALLLAPGTLYSWFRRPGA